MNKWKRVIALVCVFVMLCIGPLSAFATTADPSPSATAPQVEATPTAQGDKDQPEPTTLEDADDPEASATPTPTPTAEGNSDDLVTPTATPENSPEASVTPTAQPTEVTEVEPTPEPAGPQSESENKIESAGLFSAPALTGKGSGTGHKISVKIYKVVLNEDKPLGYETPVQVDTIVVTCTDGTGHSGYNHFVPLKAFYPTNFGLSTKDWEGWVFNEYYSGGDGNDPFYSWTSQKVNATANVTGSEPYPCSKNMYLIYEDDKPVVTYTVTYTDGVEDEVIFEDDVHSGLKKGDTTPAFRNGTPERDGYEFKGWKPDVAKTVTGNVTYVAQWEKEEEPTPTAPTAPGADDLSELLDSCVKVTCVGAGAHEPSYYQPLSDDYEIGSVENIDGQWRLTVTMKATASIGYVAAYSTYVEVAHSNEGLTDNTVTLYYENDEWKRKTGDVFEISAKCEAVHTIHVSFEGMSENNGDVTSTEPEQELTVSAPQAPEGSKFVGWSLNPSNGEVYTGKFNFSDLSKVVGDNWTSDHEAWMTFYPVFEEIIPVAPGTGELSTILGECVVVNCTEEEHESLSYAPNAADYNLSTVEKVENLWRVTVTMKATASVGYVATYSEDVSVSHSDLGFSDNTVTLYYQNGAWVKDVADVFSISAKCEKVEEIRTITVGFAKDAGGEWGESGTVTSENPTQALTPANPTAPDGKVFKGWTLTSGSSDIYTGAFTFEALSQLIEDDVWYNNEAYLTFYPVFEDEPVQEQKITVFFTLTEGEWADDVPPDSSKQFVLSSLSAEAELNAPAAAVAPEGKQFVNWSSDYCDATLDAGEAFSFNSMKDYIDGFDADGNAYITLIAQYEEVPQNKTLKIYWSIDNPDAAEWALGGNASWTETIAWSDKDNTFVMPELNVKEGYELKGWAVSGTQSNYWDAITSTFGLTGLIVEDDEGGFVSITANVVKVEEQQPEENKTLKIYWAIDNPDAAEWALGGNASWTETIAWSDKDNTFVMPELNVKEGYELKGWAVSGTQSNYWDAITSTFGLTGLIVEDDEGGFVSITANVVKVEEQQPEENKTLKIYWAIDNPDAAEWALGGDAAWTETIAWSDKDNTFVMPELNVKEGYELKGWAVSGTQSNYWDAITSTFGLTGLIVEDDEGGYVSITANVVVKTEEPVPETYTVTYTDGVDGTVFADEITTDLLAGSDTPEFKGQLVRSGFVFAGWNPEVAETVTANAVYTATWKVDSNNNGIADEDEETYTVTYTDGVSHREVFADQVYTGLLVGTKTPDFVGTPERDGYEFKGWKPAVAETVTGDAVYEATWEQNPEDDDVPKTTDNLYPIQMTLLFGSMFCLIVAAFARIKSMKLRRNR